MGRPRQKSPGTWEIAVRHPALPGGRQYLYLDSESQALAYGERLTLGVVTIMLAPGGHILGSAQVVLEHGGEIRYRERDQHPEFVITLPGPRA